MDGFTVRVILALAILSTAATLIIVGVDKWISRRRRSKTVQRVVDDAMVRAIRERDRRKADNGRRGA